MYQSITKFGRGNCKKIIHADSFVKIYLETKPAQQICPHCGTSTKKIHDYRSQTIKDLPFQLNHCYLVLKKRRYTCSCGKHFYEKYSFLPRYFQRTSRLTAFLAHSLHKNQSIQDLSLSANVSSSTVHRILDTVSYSRGNFRKSFLLMNLREMQIPVNTNVF